MAMHVESVEPNELRIKVEGDLGDLQIIEESSDSDEDRGDSKGDPQKVGTVANLPNGLVQASTTPVFGTVAVTNSENVQFGNNTFFNGPVTIKQVIQTNSGFENASYQKTEEEHISNGKSLFKSEPSSMQKLTKMKTCRKLSFTMAGAVLLVSICVVVLVTIQRNQHSSSASQNSEDNSSNHTLVVGLCSETTQIILIISVFLVPITLLLWLFFSLLIYGKEDTWSGKFDQKNTACKKTTTVHNCNRYEADDLLIAPDHLRIVSRTDWLAQPVNEKVDAIRQPVPWVIITHTATEGCFTQSACVLQVRLMQTFHIESKGWSDIAYNFLVGGDGSAYYGRGWDQIGAHTKGYNKYAISIAFIGTYNTEVPTQNQVDACKKLIKFGVAEGKLAKDYKLFAHRQLMSSLSPGDKVFDIIKTWPHFVNETNISSLIPKY